MSEREFHKLVAAWLSESFADVEHEVYLEGSGHYVDFIAHTPFHSYAIEVEDSWDSIYDGLGQASMYGAETGHIPVVVFPADTVDELELEIVRQSDVHVRIVLV